MSSEVEVLSTGDLGGIGHLPGHPGALPGVPERSAALRTLSMVGIVLAIPITLFVVTDAGVLVFSFVLFALVKAPKVRESYRLDVHIDPKYNAALLLEKARTGLPIAEIAERALNEYFSSKGSR